MGKIMIEGIKCERCGNEWIPQKHRREKGIKPKVCPLCKSPWYNIPRKVKREEIEREEEIEVQEEEIEGERDFLRDREQVYK